MEYIRVAFPKYFSREVDHCVRKLHQGKYDTELLHTRKQYRCHRLAKYILWTALKDVSLHILWSVALLPGSTHKKLVSWENFTTMTALAWSWDDSHRGEPPGSAAQIRIESFFPAVSLFISNFSDVDPYIDCKMVAIWDSHITLIALFWIHE